MDCTYISDGDRAQIKPKTFYTIIISESFNPKANLWPLTIIIAPVYSLPIFILYIVFTIIIDVGFLKENERQ